METFEFIINGVTYHCDMMRLDEALMPGMCKFLLRYHALDQFLEDSFTIDAYDNNGMPRTCSVGMTFAKRNCYITFIVSGNYSETFSIPLWDGNTFASKVEKHHGFLF